MQPNSVFLWKLFDLPLNRLLKYTTPPMGDLREHRPTFNNLPDVIPTSFSRKTLASPSPSPLELDDNMNQELDDSDDSTSNDLSINRRNDVNNNLTVATEESRIAKQLAVDIVQWAATGEGNTRCDKYAETMRSAVSKFMLRAEIPFRGLYSKMDIDGTNVCTVFRTITNEMLSDGQLNRGRLVALYSMAADMAKYFVGKGLTRHLDMFGTFVGTFVSEKYSVWLKENGGWDAFVEYFPDEHRIEKGLWKGLLATAAIGFGALATMVLVK